MLSLLQAHCWALVVALYKVCSFSSKHFCEHNNAWLFTCDINFFQRHFKSLFLHWLKTVLYKNTVKKLKKWVVIHISQRVKEKLKSCVLLQCFTFMAFRMHRQCARRCLRPGFLAECRRAELRDNEGIRQGGHKKPCHRHGQVQGRPDYI